MRPRLVLALLAAVGLAASPAAAWDGGALAASADAALTAAQPAQAVADLRRAARSVLMPDAPPPSFARKLDEAHAAWLGVVAGRVEALPTAEAFRAVRALRDEARRVKLGPEGQRALEAAVARVAARVWDASVAPAVEAGDLETALREARALRFEIGAPEPREAALLAGVKTRIDRLQGPNAPWLRQLLAHYYLRGAEPAPLFPYAGARVTALDVADGGCAALAAALRAGAKALAQGTEVAAKLSIERCAVATTTRATQKRLPFTVEVEVASNVKVPREVTYPCKVPTVVQQSVTSSFTAPAVNYNGRLTGQTETHSRTSYYPAIVEVDSTCTGTVEEYVTSTRKETRTEEEVVVAEVKRTALEVTVRGTMTVGGVDSPVTLEAAPAYEEETYTSRHSPSQASGPVRRDRLDTEAAAALSLQLGEVARRAIFERTARALEAELATDAASVAARRTELLTSIAFYRHAPPRELAAELAATTGLSEDSLGRAFRDGQIADRATTAAEAGEWLRLPSASREAEAEVFVDEERSLVIDKFSGVSTLALVTLGGHGGTGSPPYSSLGVVVRWDYTPRFLLLRKLSASLFVRPEGGMGLGNGFGYYGAAGGLAVTARTGPVSLQGMGLGGIDGRFVYGEGEDAARPSMEVPASGLFGYGATAAVSGSRVIDHRLAVTVMRKHRVEHTYPLSNTLEVLYGRGYHVGVHAEVWGDVLTGSVARAPLSAWLAIGGSLDLGNADVGDVVQSGEHEKR
jgi:hypothetical protein